MPAAQRRAGNRSQIIGMTASKKTPLPRLLYVDLFESAIRPPLSLRGTRSPGRRSEGLIATAQPSIADRRLFRFSYKTNAAVDGAPNFASRLMSNSRSFACGICNTAPGRWGFFDRPLRGFLWVFKQIPSWTRCDRMHFLHQGDAFAGDRQIGKYKNSADGPGSLISTVRTTHSDGKMRQLFP